MTWLEKTYSILAILAIHSMLPVFSKFTQSNDFAAYESCASPIYCHGQLLDTIQMARLYQDSKTFVDHTLINSVEKTLANFETFMTETNSTPTKDQVLQFVENNFYNSTELATWQPSDHNQNPSFLEKISDSKIREFAQNLVKIWPTLGRKVNSTVKANPDMHSLISVPNGFIVPGGRFRELYYWDTYWIMKGLLISEMTTTVKGMLNNFIALIQKYGFIPNGSRVYYLNRSQPPLFTSMVANYVRYTNDIEWVEENIDIIERELMGWLENRVIEVVKNGISYNLAHYDTGSGSPRPESYYEDKTVCSIFEEDSAKEKCYSELKSGAESGIDFSTKWFINENDDEGSLDQIQTSRILPVELNSYLCRAFRDFSDLLILIGRTEDAKIWLDLSLLWQVAIDVVFYNSEDGIWYDYDNELMEQRKAFLPTNFAPLWAGAYNKDQQKNLGNAAAKYLKNNGILDFPGGIPTSLKRSGQQWDLPNAWPPLQELVILGLQNSNDEEAQEVALQLANIWINANIIGFSTTGEMFEKYDAEVAGQYGGGGEYVVQAGFGWSNGVALSLIDTFFTKNSTISHTKIIKKEQKIISLLNNKS